MKSLITTSVRSILPLVSLLALSWIAARAETATNPASEPLLERVSWSKAAAYLDAGAHAHEKSCFACHATYAYLSARPALAATASAQRETRQALERSAAKLAAEKLSPEDKADRVTAVVMTAVALAQDDAAVGGKLQPLTRRILDRIWDVQREDGGWNWVKANEPPSGLDDHFGVTTAAIGVAAAPDGYAGTPQARHGLDGLRRYLRAHPPATMHQRAMLLLASAGVDGLMSRQQARQTADDLFSLQRPDGGWAMAGLGDWKRVDGQPLDRTASDGYGTGFVLYVLRRGAGVPAEDPRVHKAVAWLETHQRASGCWFTRSPRKNDELSTYVGTVYAIRALDACGEIQVHSPYKTIEARFNAKVEWIEMAGKRDAEVVPIGIDAHWLVGIEILSIEKSAKPFDKKGKEILLIHSPAILFAGDEKAPGETYSFKVLGNMRNGRPEFYCVEAQENKSNKSPEKKQP